MRLYVTRGFRSDNGDKAPTSDTSSLKIFQIPIRDIGIQNGGRLRIRGRIAHLQSHFAAAGADHAHRRPQPDLGLWVEVPMAAYGGC